MKLRPAGGATSLIKNRDPVPSRTSDGPRNCGEAGVIISRLAPDIAPRHYRNGVPFALILAYQLGAGL
jgi:hypothetical protein